MMTNFWLLLPVIFLCLGLLTACSGDNDDTDDVAPTGDPTQAARAFMTAFLNGNLEGCQAFSSSESQASVLQLCEQRAAVQSQASLRDVTFTEVQHDGRYAFIEMAGSYTQTFVDPSSGNMVETEVTEPLVIVMYYQNGFWRFDDFATDN